MVILLLLRDRKQLFPSNVLHECKSFCPRVTSAGVDLCGVVSCDLEVVDIVYAQFFILCVGAA